MNLLVEKSGIKSSRLYRAFKYLIGNAFIEKITIKDGKRRGIFRIKLIKEEIAHNEYQAEQEAKSQKKTPPIKKAVDNSEPPGPNWNIKDESCYAKTGD